MSDFEITSPQGQKFRITAPDGATQEQVLAYAQANMPKAKAPDAIDQSALNFAKDMSGPAQFTAGMGGAFQNIIDASKQLVGAGPNAEDVAARRKLDAPLNRTGAGLAGNVSGNIAALAPAALIPGANTVAGTAALGGLAAALTPTEGVMERLGNMGGGMALGGATQALARYPMEAMDAVKSFATAPFKAAKAAVEPFYQGGRDQILARSLREATAQNPQVQTRLANAAELVPGSQPTAAEVGNSPGLAAMQRSAAAVNPEAYATRAAQQNEARVAAVQDMAGTGGQRDFYDAARRTAANDLYEEAYKAGIDPLLLTSGRKGEITKLLDRPAIQEAVKTARTLAKNEGVNLRDPAGSVKGLDYVKRALDDQIKGAQGNEQRILTDLKNRLLTTIDTLSPKYAEARTTFQAMSKPINQMDVAQEIADKSINKLTGALSPQQFARNFTDDVAARATGFNKATLEGTMEPQQLQVLQALKEDLARSVSARDLGRGPGSDTVQKLAMSNLMQRAGLPQGVLNMPMLGRVGNWAYSVADQRMKQQLAEALLNPKETARIMNAAPALPPAFATPPQLGNKSALLARSLMLPAIPAMVQQ